ncbi:uncharacterized protein LOC105662151 isoform X5 [Megachile rotundata]|uniref:uncharacterized protein LOC105662151 isoform X5 n=1 Tax=Megachile rotundata TaxID=143995 RepID=UPI003FD2F128
MESLQWRNITSLDHPWISKRFVGIFARRNAGTDGHRTFSSSEWQNVDGYRDAEEAGPDIKKKVDLRAQERSSNEENESKAKGASTIISRGALPSKTGIP